MFLYLTIETTFFFSLSQEFHKKLTQKKITFKEIIRSTAMPLQKNMDMKKTHIEKFTYYNNIPHASEQYVQINFTNRCTTCECHY